MLNLVHVLTASANLLFPSDIPETNLTNHSNNSIPIKREEKKVYVEGFVAISRKDDIEPLSNSEGYTRNSGSDTDRRRAEQYSLNSKRYAR